MMTPISPFINSPQSQGIHEVCTYMKNSYLVHLHGNEVNLCIKSIRRKGNFHPISLLLTETEVDRQILSTCFFAQSTNIVQIVKQTIFHQDGTWFQVSKIFSLTVFVLSEDGHVARFSVQAYVFNDVGYWDFRWSWQEGFFAFANLLNQLCIVVWKIDLLADKGPVVISVEIMAISSRFCCSVYYVALANC